MKNQIQVKRKIFGKVEDLPKFILWNTKHHGDKSYSITKCPLSEILTFDNPSISSNINFHDEFFILDEDVFFLDLENFESYLSKFDKKANYISLVEITEDEYKVIYMHGKNKFFKLYDSESSKPFTNQDAERKFIRFGVVWIYELENLIKTL